MPRHEGTSGREKELFLKGDVKSRFGDRIGLPRRDLMAGGAKPPLSGCARLKVEVL